MGFTNDPFRSLRKGKFKKFVTRPLKKLKKLNSAMDVTVFNVKKCNGFSMLLKPALEPPQYMIRP